MPPMRKPSSSPALPAVALEDVAALVHEPAPVVPRHPAVDPALAHDHHRPADDAHGGVTPLDRGAHDVHRCPLARPHGHATGHDAAVRDAHAAAPRGHHAVPGVC